MAMDGHHLRSLTIWGHWLRYRSQCQNLEKPFRFRTSKMDKAGFCPLSGNSLLSHTIAVKRGQVGT